MDPTDVPEHLPLTPVALEILLAVADEERHGYAIMQEIEAATAGAMRLNPGTLYRAVGRLVDEGLLEERPAREAPDQGGRARRFYRPTALGLAVARAEIERLELQVRTARATRALGEA